MERSGFRPRTIGSSVQGRDRTPWLLALLFVAGLVFAGRLFVLQVVKHDSYKEAALAEQLKKFSIPAERGTISVMDGDREIPVVLNETKYLLYADPGIVEKPQQVADSLQQIIGGKQEEIEKKLTADSRYEVIASKLNKQTADKIKQLGLRGIVLQEQRLRTYPEGTFAAQVLGFVNSDGKGQYGVEGYLDQSLRGKDGQLRAVTDVHGVPLAGNSDNIVTRPEPGSDITLTLDMTVQTIIEESIKKSVEETRAKSGSIVVMDIDSGAIAGMANWPSFDPAKYDQVSDLSLFKNRAVTDPMEVGSIMKTLTVAAAIDQGLVERESTFFDNGYQEVDGLKITNAINFGTGTFSIFDIIKNSMNTGAVYLVKQMGGGEINQRARIRWHNYLTDHYQFGKKTGVEQIGEEAGIIPEPTGTSGLNIQYANTSFGQGMTVHIVHMAAALAAALNGGTYYEPTLVYSTTDKTGRETIAMPKVVKTNVISESASNDLVTLMKRYADQNNREATREGFSVGGKTGTAQIPDSSGGYREDAYNGTYAGFVGGSRPKYVIIIRVDEPKNGGFAGSSAARPVFTEVANAIMDRLPFAIGQ